MSPATASKALSRPSLTASALVASTGISMLLDIGGLYGKDAHAIINTAGGRKQIRNVIDDRGGKGAHTLELIVGIISIVDRADIVERTLVSDSKDADTILSCARGKQVVVPSASTVASELTPRVGRIVGIRDGHAIAQEAVRARP